MSGQPKPNTVAAAHARIDELEARLAEMEQRFLILLPPEARALTWEQVMAAKADHPFVRLEVLVEFKVPGQGARWRPGKQLRPADYPHIGDLVRSGLKLGVPRDNMEIVNSLRDQAKALRDTAAASSAAAQADAARAAAAANADQADGLASRADTAEAKAAAV